MLSIATLSTSLATPLRAISTAASLPDRVNDGFFAPLYFGVICGSPLGEYSGLRNNRLLAAFPGVRGGIVQLFDKLWAGLWVGLVTYLQSLRERFFWAPSSCHSSR